MVRPLTLIFASAFFVLPSSGKAEAGISGDQPVQGKAIFTGLGGQFEKQFFQWCQG
jgi:hypothetical protein